MRCLSLLFALILTAVPAARAQSIPGVNDKELKDAMTAFIAAEEVVLGTRRSPDKMLDWIRDYAAKDPSQKIQSGAFNYLDAFNALRDEWANESLAIQVIERAVKDATGRSARPADSEYWRPLIAAKKAWYLPIKAAENKKVQADPFWRRYAIEEAYMNVFGRVADEGNLQYWTPRPAAYREIHDANVAWLYSANGAAELKLTVARALHDRYLSYSDQAFNELMNVSRSKGLSYVGMKDWLSSRH